MKIILALMLNTLKRAILTKTMFFWSARFLASQTDNLMDDSAVKLLESLMNGDNKSAELAIKELAAALAENSRD